MPVFLRQENYFEFEASVCYIVRSKPTWATERNLVLKTKQTTTKNRQM